MATHSRILYLENPMDRGDWQATVQGATRVGHDLAAKQPPQSPIGEINSSILTNAKLDLTSPLSTEEL